MAIVIASVSGMLYAEKLPRIEMRMSNGALVIQSQMNNILDMTKFVSNTLVFGFGKK